ncbi:MAG: response regulator, partial [Desulfuromonadaceae bacterium]|nr:response regulator [Desulfuromonadaceae bacterium]
MKFYSNLKIGKKLTLGFAAVVTMALSIGLFGYIQIHILAKADDMLFEKGVKPVEYVSDLSTDFQRLRVNIREFITAGNRREFDFYEGRVLKFSYEVDTTFKKLETSLPDEESKRLFYLLEQTHNLYSPQVQNIIELSKVSGSEESLKYVKSDKFASAEKAEIDAIENLKLYLVSNAEKISDKNTETATDTGRIMLILVFAALLLAMFMSVLIARSILRPLHRVSDALAEQQGAAKERASVIEAIARGDLTQDIRVAEKVVISEEQLSMDEPGMLLRAISEMSLLQNSVDRAFTEMTSALRHNFEQEADYRREQEKHREEEAQRDWFKNGLNELNNILRGEKTTEDMTERVLMFLSEYIGAGVGVFYIYNDEDSSLQIYSSYAFTRRKRLNDRISLGEGLAGQAAVERKMICLNEAPPDYLPIGSALGEAEPLNIVVMPLIHNDAIVGILEFGAFKIFSDRELKFLNQSMEGIAIALGVNKSRKRVDELLQKTQSQAEELRVQQEELQQTNEELEERAQMLEQQREQIRAKNRELERASREVQRKADELERVSTYKSEFLSNMSHELRTPLNSLMILSSILKENSEGNLTEKQVEFATTINGAGRDLLTLINDILDLSKIESGRLEFVYEDFTPYEICDQLVKLFNPIADEKGIDFSVEIEESAPQSINVDGQRTQQILKNLLSNACKFTGSGSVKLRIFSPPESENTLECPAIAFAVSDTGIGIAEDKQTLVFNAFQQADGSTSRIYGGTGLGLSISRQLARSMGGEIDLVSLVGKGSTFTLHLPVTHNIINKPVTAIGQNPVVINTPPPESLKITAPKNIELLPPPIPDDRNTLDEESKCILIIEDDVVFAGILLDMVRKRGFFVLLAGDGESGIMLAERYHPNAIILDVMLPHIDGWGVMRSLKDNPETRHIPVHFITCLEERQKAMNMGAIGFVTKPVSSEQLDTVFGTLEAAIDKSVRLLLIVEDNKAEAAAMVALLEVRDVSITVAETGSKAIQLISNQQFDCIVLDLGLADMSAFELLEEIKKLDPERRVPVIIHTGRELTREDEKRLHHYAESIIIKGAKSPERLLNEVSLFLHLVETSLDPEKQRMIRT